MRAAYSLRVRTPLWRLRSIGTPLRIWCTCGALVLALAHNVVRGHSRGRSTRNEPRSQTVACVTSGIEVLREHLVAVRNAVARGEHRTFHNPCYALVG